MLIALDSQDPEFLGYVQPQFLEEIIVIIVNKFYK